MRTLDLVSVMSALNWDDRANLYAYLKDESLRTFVKFAWGLVESSQEYVHGWHVDAICDHLEAVTRGDILKLIINIPPRHGKSTLISVLWPAWVWTKQPEVKWLFGSYAAALSIRDNIRFKDVIKSDFYQGLFGNKITNTKRGHRIATSVTGGSTGEGGDYIVADDPHKIEESESEIARQTAIDWWVQTINTRKNNPATTRMVLVMQRVHENDLSGYLLEHGKGFTHLCLPTKYEKKVYITPIGWQDPRKEEGELLWPKRFTQEVVDDLEFELGPYGFASKYQQRPAPKAGAMFQPQWFRLETGYPIEVKKIVRFWDKAGTSGGGAYTVGVRMSVSLNNIVYVEDVIRAQLDDLDRERLIRQTAERDRMRAPHTQIWLEQEGGSGGKDSIAASIRNLAGYIVFAERPTGDKATRASPYAAYAKAGNVVLCNGPWVDAYLKELSFFPFGKYKDQVDASSGAFNKLFTGGTVRNVGG